MPAKPVIKKPSKPRLTRASKWATRRFSRISLLRKGTVMPTKIAPDEKLRLLPKKRADELCAVIPDLSKFSARRLLSNANRALLLNGGNFTKLLRRFSDLMKPSELRPEHFSVRNIEELVDLCNRKPELRYARFFEVNPNQRVEANLNGKRYRGHAVSVGEDKVTIRFDNEARKTAHKRGTIVLPIEPFSRVFSLKDRKLVRVREGMKTGIVLPRESLQSLISQDK
ncbi:MAG: hypothetical protein AABW72_04245 [archaeon]